MLGVEVEFRGFDVVQLLGSFLEFDYLFGAGFSNSLIAGFSLTCE
jgi:hypothetical protein